jgi:phosphorylcholine metabolism protein LicD
MELVLVRTEGKTVAGQKHKPQQVYHAKASPSSMADEVVHPMALTVHDKPINLDVEWLDIVDDHSNASNKKMK